MQIDFIKDKIMLSKKQSELKKQILGVVSLHFASKKKERERERS
jgi:hypothetical protein